MSQVEKLRFEVQPFPSQTIMARQKIENKVWLLPNHTKKRLGDGRVEGKEKRSLVSISFETTIFIPLTPKNTVASCTVVEFRVNGRFSNWRT